MQEYFSVFVYVVFLAKKVTFDLIFPGQKDYIYKNW